MWDYNYSIHYFLKKKKSERLFNIFYVAVFVNIIVIIFTYLLHT